MKTVFFTCYDARYTKTIQGLKNSVKRFYPDIDFIEAEMPITGDFDTLKFCDFHLDCGLKLFDDYDRIISLDGDQIMCAPCPDFFGNYDMGVVRNNIPFEIPEETTKANVYINAGTTVCTNKETWKEWMAEYRDRCDHTFPGERRNEQDALNWLFHTSKYVYALLEFDDKVYGISAMDYGYPNMYVDGDELRVRWKDLSKWHDKKLCLFHAAGVDWKDNMGNFRYDKIEDPKAREKLRSFTL